MKKIDSQGPLVDIEKCIDKVGGSRYEMILIASQRSREILKQHASKTDYSTGPGATVQSLLEIQEGKIGTEYLEKIKFNRVP
jgi:DNA-directed RNA polymerase omega subunit